MRWFGFIFCAVIIASCTTSTDPQDPSTTCETTEIQDMTGMEIDGTGYDGWITISQYGHGVGPLWGTFSVEASFIEPDYGRTVSAGGLIVGSYQIAPQRMESGEIRYSLSEPYEESPQDKMVSIEVGGDPVSSFPGMMSEMYVPSQFDVEIEGYEHGAGHRDTISLSSDLVLSWDPGSMDDATVVVTLDYQPDDPNAEVRTWSYTYENTGTCTIPQYALQQLAPPGATFGLWLRRQYVRCVTSGSKRYQITSKAALYSWVRSVE